MATGWSQQQARFSRTYRIPPSRSPLVFYGYRLSSRATEVPRAFSASAQGVELTLEKACEASLGWQVYWKVAMTPEAREDFNAVYANTTVPDPARCDLVGGLTLWTLSAKIIDTHSAFAAFVSGYGMTGLYTTFVLVVATAIRSYMAGLHANIIWDDMEDVAALKELCHDLYAARENGDLKSEERLYTHLISIYRSPEEIKRLTSKCLLYPEDAHEYVGLGKAKTD